MSYDLFVLFKPPDDLPRRWEGVLLDEGMPGQFADVPHDLDALDREEWMLDDAPALLQPKLAASTHAAYFRTSAGRTSDDLAMQLFGAAALAKATDGVLYDPQEDCYRDGDDALAFARGELERYRRAEAAQAVRAAEREAALEELRRLWLWFQGIFVAACAVWVFYFGFMFAMRPLGIDPSARWVPAVTVVPLLAAVFLAVRTSRQVLGALGVGWPLRSIVGLLAAFLPVHAAVYAWARKRYRALLAEA